MKLHPYFIQLKKINSKCIEDLNIRPETVKLLEENIGKKVLDTILGNDFLDMTPKAQATKNKNKQVGLHQTKKLLHGKGNNRQNKVINRVGENICKLSSSIRAAITKN